MRRFLGYLMLPALLASAALAKSNPPFSDEAAPILQGLSQITGWKIESQVPAEILHQKDFRKFMEANVK
ncbi:MAG TPA: hypothetical protein VFW83_07240, partial [Bryobacteraceae bacterium]|nr:hypothetical protein [Bryobacteraceae bacterium]